MHDHNLHETFGHTDLSVDSHFKTQLNKLVRTCESICMYVCMHAKIGKEMQGLLCMDNHDVHVIFGPRPIHRLQFQNTTPPIGTCVSVCMYAKKGKEMHGMLCMDDHDSHFKTRTRQTDTCMYVCMYP